MSYGLKPKKRFFKPSSKQVDRYLQKWEKLDNYRLQEIALDKLFTELAPKNDKLEDILLKAAALNDFYSTNIFSIYPVALHIFELDIDEALNNGDESIVEKIQNVKIGRKNKSFYSFATKYCSHHNPVDYPIYDSYVDKVLRYLKREYKFSSFENDDLKDYEHFKAILKEFREFFGLNNYSLKELDRYLWLVGKEQFPIDYKKINKGKKEI